MSASTQTKGTASSKRNPCPICLKDHGCKISDSKILCLRGDRSFNVPGWKWVKEARNAMGGVFVPDNGTESNFDREEWKREQAKLREAERKRKANSLSEEQRDRNARSILRELGLSSRHRADLHRRGLTDAQIEEIGFKTVEAGQRLIVPINSDFPGANITGDQLKNADGYLVPIFNEHNQIIGFQNATDDRENGKYKWLKSAASSHLPSGELPLTIRRVEGDRDVRLCEGTSKPLIASYRHNKTFIGASGGQFAGSPQLLKRYLEADKPRRVILCPDAGWNCNPHVRKAIEATAELLTEWGYTVYWEDWGQSDSKKNPDIDEISSHEKRVLKKWKAQKQNEIEQAARSQWLDSKKYTPTPNDIQNNPYIDFELPSEGSSLVIKSGLGTGKTETLARRIMPILKSLNIGVIVLGSRNSLLIQTGNRWRLFIYTKIEKEPRKKSLNPMEKSPSVPIV